MANSSTLGDRIMKQLNKRGKATTEELAVSLKATEKDVYSRAWWLAAKDGLLKSTGHGKQRTWKLTAKGAKSLAG